MDLFLAPSALPPYGRYAPKASEVFLLAESDLSSLTLLGELLEFDLLSLPVEEEDLTHSQSGMYGSSLGLSGESTRFWMAPFWANWSSSGFSPSD